MHKTDIDFLNVKMFPSNLVNRARLGVSEGTARVQAELYDNRSRIYVAVLKSLSAETIKALADDERDLERSSGEEIADILDSNRFFNRPDSDARFEYWCNQSSWTLDEATALSTGKDPRSVNWARVGPMIKDSPFSQKFAGIRNHFISAAYKGQLKDPTPPGAFVRWALSNGVVIPIELEARFSHLLSAAGNERSQKPKTETTGIAAHQVDPKGQLHGVQSTVGPAPASGAIIQIDRQVTRLNALREHMKRTSTGPSCDESDQDSGHMQLLESALVGIAVARYGYKPGRSKPSVLQKIARDLERVGVRMTTARLAQLLGTSTANQQNSATGSELLSVQKISA